MFNADESLSSVVCLCLQIIACVPLCCLIDCDCNDKLYILSLEAKCCIDHVKFTAIVIRKLFFEVVA